jgi:DNA polymerase-3 subunit alpha
MNENFKNNEVRPPRKFVGLHAHSTFSIGDAIGLPQEHIDFALKNGSDALALTDHGNMNGISHQQMKQAALDKAGIKFKTIPGIEAYFIDDLDQWKALKNAQAIKKIKEKKEKKIKTEENSLDAIGNEFADLEEELTNKEKDEEEEGETVVEDEESSKSKIFDPLKQRDHIVLLPKNTEGLKAIFKLTSKSFIDGFYGYPRIDLKMLEEHVKGNVIALQACLAGNLAKIIYDNLPEGDIKSMGPDTDHDFDKVQKELEKKLRIFQQIFGKENYFLEIQANKLPIQHLVNKHFLFLAKRTGTPIVATADSHYANPEHWRAREIYKAMAWASKTKKDVDVKTLPEKIDQLKCVLYPKNHEQMWESFVEYTKPYKKHFEEYMQDISDAIERTYTIAHEMIDEVRIEKKVRLPGIDKLISEEDKKKLIEKYGQLSEEDLLFKQLVNLSIEGLKFRKKQNKKEYIERLKKELEDIKYLQKNTKFDYVKYFLTYKKIMDITSKKLFTGNGRGSVSGSMLAYVLNISQVDPIKFGTLWERFLSRKKKSAADIDNDWSDRDEAVKMLREYFGFENVVSVSNFNQLQLRSLIKDVARLYGIPFEEINAMTSKIELEAMTAAKSQPGFDRQTWVLTFEEAEKNSETFRKLLEKYPSFSETIKILFKQMRNISRHAGGVVITDQAPDIMPVIKFGGILQTPWPEGLNYRHLEEFGLLKFDILGLGTLRIFEEVVRKILIKQGNPNPTFEEIKKWFWDNLHPDNNDMDDPAVYKHVFHDGHYMGIFQFVQPMTQKFMRQMKPKNIMDIAIATSIFRPGPLQLGVDKMFLENRKNPKKVKLAHPLLEEILKETENLLIFQEQLQMIYHKLAGVPLEETDSVRKAFTKKDISNKEQAIKEREELKENFLRLCKSANNIDPEISSKIFDEMEALVAYSFNKSHAIAYAITTYQCAWFLTYYPDEWVTTNIDYATISKGKIIGKEDPKTVAIMEAQQLGYKIKKADINYSAYGFTSKNKDLYPGFASMKYTGLAVFQEIEKFRPYKTLEDLLINPDGSWRHSKFNKRALATLIQLEALDSMNLIGEGKTFKNYRQIYLALIENYDKLRTISKRKKDNSIKNELEKIIQSVLEEPDWTKEEKIQNFLTLAGSINTSLIISDEKKNELEELGFSSIDFCNENYGKHWAIISNAINATTKTGKPYIKLTLLSETNNKYDCYLWNYKGKAEDFPLYSVIVGVFSKTNYGISVNAGTLNMVNT